MVDIFLMCSLSPVHTNVDDLRWGTISGDTVMVAMRPTTGELATISFVEVVGVRLGLCPLRAEREQPKDFKYISVY